MPTHHHVEKGDSVIRLADRHGHLPATIWNDAANADLRQRRTDMNILLPGDVVVIPDVRARLEKRATGQTHKFRRKGLPAIFRLQVFDMNVPVASQPYRLLIDGVERAGTTDAQGIVEESVPASAQEGQLIVGQGDEAVTLVLQFGHLDPLNEISGVQHRLTNLGYDCGPETGVVDEATRLALLDFQRDHQLETTGTVDAPTKARLEEVHDNPYRYPPPADGGSA